MSVREVKSCKHLITKSQEYLLKLIIIGDCGVGKTNILVRFCDNVYKPNYVATIGVDFKLKSMMIGDKKIKFQIWDTAGQQRYRTIAQTYYKGVAGIILTYSITDDRSFENLESWMKQINQHAPANVKKILVANKSDLEEQRKVQILEGQTLADKYGIQFLEVSAKNGDNIAQIFQMLGQSLAQQYIPSMKSYRRDLSGILDTSNFSIKKSQQNKKNCAC